MEAFALSRSSGLPFFSRTTFLHSRTEVLVPQKLFFSRVKYSESGVDGSFSLRVEPQTLLLAEKEEAKALLSLFLKKLGLSSVLAARIINKSDGFIDHLLSQLHSVHKSRYLVGRELTTLEIRDALNPYLETLLEEYGSILVEFVENFPNPPAPVKKKAKDIVHKQPVPIYGFASGDPSRFKRAAGHKDLFYIEEKELEFKEVIEAPLPKAPLDTAVVTHWLAIEGVQPAIPENPPPMSIQTLAMPSDNIKNDYKEDGLPVEIKLPVKHVLSRELQLYFEKISELTVTRSDSTLFKEALVSLATDSGLHPLVPYFTFFVADEVSRNLNNFSILFALMRLVWSLLRNQHIHIEPYLHQLMPSVMTCLVAKRLGNKFSDNHWSLRNFTAILVASICKRFGHVYHNLQPRVTRTLLHAFLDPSKALPQHYGAIQGLSALGPNVVRLLVLPNLEPYLRLLEPEMQLEKQKNEIKRHEAWLVYGALMRAAGLCLYYRLKMLPSVFSILPRTFSSNAKVVTALSNKRKAGIDNTMHQPPAKKLMTDSSMTSGVIQANSVPADMPGAGGAYPANIRAGDTNLQGSRPLGNNDVAGPSGRKEIGVGQPLKASSVFDQEDANAGNLLPLLSEYFGESMLSFVPSPVLSLFL